MDLAINQTSTSTTRSTGSSAAIWNGGRVDRTPARRSSTTVNVGAIIEQVLRQAYVEGSKDLLHFAETVRFHNELKQQIRDELGRARQALAAMLDKNPEAKPNELIGGGGVEMPGADAELPFTPVGRVVKTAGGYYVDTDVERLDGHTVKIYDAAGKLLTKIDGDPHVSEGAGGWNWHFGKDSTFILPDGSKLCLRTATRGGGELYVRALDVISGAERAHVGPQALPGGGGIFGAVAGAINAVVGAEAGGFAETKVYRDGAEWDRAHADSAGDASSGVFALQSNGQWAALGADGRFYDVDDETWNHYTRNGHNVDVSGRAAVGLTAQQTRAATDVDQTGAFAGVVFGDKPSFDAEGKPQVSTQAHAPIETRADLEAYMKELDEKLASVGDDAQLANIDLQSQLQRQQQTLQTLGNVSKMLHDTAVSLIRKIG